jgi:hypothetical protein
MVSSSHAQALLVAWLVGNSHIAAFTTPHWPIPHGLRPTTSQLFDIPNNNSNNKEQQQLVNDELRADTVRALQSVGWMSLPSEGELTSDDPFVQAINAGIQRDMGVPLDGLLNPAKVVNLESELYAFRMQLAEWTGASLGGASNDPTSWTTEQCDAGGGGDQADELRAKIAKKEADLFVERRSVFRDWLKTVFLVQAVGSLGLSFVMATRPALLFGGFDWFYSYNMDISIQVLGYWWWWLFVVPSLRSRRPKGPEKRALDIAFLGTPLISILAPVATKDTGVIWTANLMVVAGSYAFAFFMEGNDDDGNDIETDANKPEWLRFVYKSLDFGSGRERGARK